MAGIQDWYQKTNPLQDAALGASSEDTGRDMSPMPKATTDFQKWATGIQGEQKLAASMRQARNENPDLKAEVFNLQGKTGLPAELIQRNLDMVRERVSQQDFDAKKFRQDFPKLAGAMEDPDTASVAHDDLDSLQLMERVLSSGSAPGNGTYGVVDPAALRRQMLSGEITPDEYRELHPKYRQPLLRDATVAANLDADQSAVQNAAWQALERGNAQERFQDMGTLEWFTKAPAAAWRQGRLAEDRNGLAFEQMMGGGDPSLEGRLVEMEGQLGRKFGDETLGGGILVSAAEFAPMTISSLAAGVKTGIPAALAAGGVAAVAGQAGPQIAFPEEVVTVPGAAAMGFAAGSRTGAAEYSFRQEAGGAYREFKAFRDEDGVPMDNATATVAAVVSGSVNAGLEMFGLETLVKSFPGGEKVLGGITRNSIKQALKTPTVRKAFADLGKRFAGVWSIETMTEVAQEGVVILGGELAKTFNSADFEGVTAEQVEERLTETFKMAAQGMLLMSAPGPMTTFAMDYGKARGAQQTQDRMEALGEGARASKLRERMPAKYKQIIEKLQANGPIDAVQVPVERWNELFQMRGIDPAEMANEVVGNYDSYSEAMASGGDFVIPLADYVEKLAATDFHQEMTENARFNPGDMTPREAREWMANAPEATQSYIDEMANAPADPSQAVYEDVIGQLTSAGRDRTAAENEARLTQSVFRTLGERTGQDPAELYRQYGINITRPLPEVLRQATKNVDTDLDPLIDRLRSGDIPSQRDAFGESLVEFLRERGINDEGGELAARDADVGRKAFQRALTRPDGMTLDDAAQAAAEAGYLTGQDRSTVTQQDLLDAIDRELAGEPVYTPGGANTQQQNMIEVLNSLGDYIEEMGGDLDAMDNPTIKALMKGEQISQPDPESDATTLNQDAATREQVEAELAEQAGDDRSLFDDAEWQAFIDEELAKRQPQAPAAPGSMQQARDLAASLEQQFPGLTLNLGGRDGKITIDRIELRGDLRESGTGTQVMNAITGWADDTGATLALTPSDSFGGNVKRLKEFYKRSGFVDNKGAAKDFEVSESMIREPAETLNQGGSVVEVFRGVGGDSGEGRYYTQDREFAREFTLSGQDREIRRRYIPETDIYESDTLPFAGDVDAIDSAIAEAELQGKKAIKVSEGEGQSPSIFVIDDSALFRSNLGASRAYKQGGRQPRGRISFPQSRKFFNIELLEQANLSTFIHESGHLYLEILGDLAGRENAPQQLVDDYQIVLDWFGVDSADAIGVDQHEQWARGFEAYVMEGKSPSSAMREAFARFKAWMVAIYRTVANLDVELSDEVRGVMDRLVATDQEISEAALESGYQPIFTDATAAGMSEAEYQAYAAAAQRARESAEESLSRKVMTEYQRETKRWWKNAKEEMTAEVAGEVNQQPAYVAMAVMGRGKLPDSSPLPEGMEQFKLNKAALVEKYGEPFLKRLPRPYIYTRQGGVHPDMAAEVFGYTSGDEMIQDIVNARPRRKLIESEVDVRMREQYGDMLNDGSMADAAFEAVHNDQRSNVMQAELRTLSRRSGARQSPVSIIKDAAQRIMSDKRVRDIKPGLYLRAEQKAGREAFDAAASGDYAKATEAKQRQLLNHHLYREATRARDDADSVQTYMARFNKKPTRVRLAKAGQEYIDQIDALLTRYEFKKTSLRRIDRRRSLEAWIGEQQAEGFTIDVPDAVMDDSRVVNWREVAIDELRGMRDAVKQIEHLARTKNKLLAEKDKRDFEAQVDTVVSAIEANHTRVERSVPLHESLREKVGNWVGNAHAWHTKPEFLFRWLDGDAEVGPVWQAMFKPLADAESVEQQMQEKATKELQRILGAYTREERAKWYAEKHYVHQVGQSIDKARMMAIALNWGNEYNREVLMEGYGWNAGQVDAILSYFDERDWLVVQELWDFIDGFWPDIKSMEEDLNGIAPKKVEASAIETPAGTLRGGYYPIKYDTRTSYKAFQREEKAGASLFENSFTRPATRTGHTKERQGSGGQKLRLDIDVLSEHLGQVIHDLSHRRAVIDVNRLASNDQVRSAIEETAGTEMYRQIRPWLQSIANEVNQPESYWEKLIGQARVGATVVNMGLKVTTAVVQPLGYMNSIDMLGAKYAWKGLTDFFGSRGNGRSYATWANMKTGTAFVHERSTMMLNRQKTFDRDVRDSLQRMTKETKLQEWQRSFFIMTGLMDMAVSVPTWLGAYRKAMEGEVSEIEMGNEPRAIDYADSIVRQTQSAGGVKDLAQIQRGGQVRRSFVMFYSYFSVLYNQFARQISNVKQGNISLPRLAASAFFLWFAPSILGELVAGRGPDDEDEWAEWAARQGILYPMGAVVGLRDVGSAVLTPFGYGASPAFDAFEMTARTASIPLKALDEDQELGRSDVKAAVLTAGYWGKLPSRQAWITGEYMFDVMTGEEKPDDPGEFVKNMFFARPADERN